MSATERTTMNGKPVFTVPVKTVLNLQSGFKAKLLCDGPALSLGDACAYSCSFCYVPAVYRKLDRVHDLLARKGLKHEDVVIRRGAAIEVLRGQLLNPNGKPRFPDPSDRRVIYMSPADDVGANMDLVNATIEACKEILTHTHWQIRLLSKSTMLPRIAAALVEWAKDGNPRFEREEAVADFAVRSRLIFGVSTGTLDDDVAKVIEEGTPLVSKRIQSLHVLQDNGFRTFAMVCPSLPFQTTEEANTFASAAEVALRYDRCEHVWAEVINLRGESFTRTIAALEKAGLDRTANGLREVAESPTNWEEQNRRTFLAHAYAQRGMGHLGKLRFLTYVTPATRPWWETKIAEGAVIL